mgnify:CR=1 FL=1
MRETGSLLKSFLGFFNNLNRNRKFQFILVLLSNTISGLFEFLIVGSVGIFITSITEPNLLFESKQIIFIKQFILIDNISILAKVIFWFFITIIILSTLIRLLNLWIMHKFNINFFGDLSKKAFQKILYQDYEYHLKTNSSQLISNLTFNMDQTSNFVNQFLVLFNYSISSLCIISAIIFINSKLTLTILLTIGITYLFLTSFIYRKIEKYGRIQVDSNKKVVKTIQEGIGSIKNIILENNQEYHLNKFNISVVKVRTYQSLVNLFAQSPKFFIEGIGLIIIASVGYLISSNNNSMSAIAFLGSFALGAQKLLPSLQNIYSGWTNLIAFNKGFEKILDLLDLKVTYKIKALNQKSKFKNNIITKDLSFKFESSDNFALKKINLKINKGEKIGLMGKTGSGKSTFINIIMGLLKPSAGLLMVDNVNIFDEISKDNLINWRKEISQVPQKLYLSDTSILENIAFGLDEKDIDIDKVFSSAKNACILDYINQTKYNFYTKVGEQGTKMSGGQVQRIGLARALYRDSSLLILDEATSALDINTEKKVMRHINEISKSTTIILVAHRLSTLYNCDRVIEFENGTIKKIITGEELKKQTAK